MRLRRKTRVSVSNAAAAPTPTPTPPAGLDGQVQWNNSGAFGADSGFSYLAGSGQISLGSTTLVQSGGIVFVDPLTPNILQLNGPANIAQNIVINLPLIPCPGNNYLITSDAGQQMGYISQASFDPAGAAAAAQTAAATALSGAVIVYNLSAISAAFGTGFTGTISFTDGTLTPHSLIFINGICQTGSF